MTELTLRKLDDTNQISIPEALAFVVAARVPFGLSWIMYAPESITVRKSCPLAISHTLIAPAPSPTTRRLLSELKASTGMLVWGSSIVRIGVSPFASQIMTRPSMVPPAR